MLPVLILCLFPAWGPADGWTLSQSPSRGLDGGKEALYNGTGHTHSVEEKDRFLHFLHRQHRQYHAGSREYQKREQRFWESVQRQKHLNSMPLSADGNNTALYGINQFSDLSPKEFKDTFLRSFTTKLPLLSSIANGNVEQKPLPVKFDWRDQSVVTPVNDQLSCGSCWAFSVVEAMESVSAIQRQPLEELSVQQVIDCSSTNNGCQGGSPIGALAWLNQTQVKLVRYSEYSYKAKNGMCHYFPHSDFGVSIKGFEAYTFRDHEEEMMRKLVNLGPLIVLVDALSWQDYLGGIIQHHCSSGDSNHAVLITGFDKSGAIPYWIVRNSWGASWGVDGYAHVKIGGNVCGIADTVAATFV